MTPINQALIFATQAHASIDQRRKYTDEPYIVHPIEVMMLVRDHGGTEAMQMAAVLHDVVEDTPTRVSHVFLRFGGEVAGMVWALTDTEIGNRDQRVVKARDRLAKASAEVQTIKVADLISNTRTIVKRDPGFAKVYIPLLEVLRKADPELRRLAWSMI